MASQWKRVCVLFSIPFIFSAGLALGMHNPRFSGMQAMLVTSDPSHVDPDFCRAMLGLGDMPDPAIFNGELRQRCQQAQALGHELIFRLIQGEPEPADILNRWQEAAYHEARFVDERDAGDTRGEVELLANPALSPQMQIGFGGVALLGAEGDDGRTIVLYPPVEPQIGGTCGWNALDYLPALERFLGSDAGALWLARVEAAGGDIGALQQQANKQLGDGLVREGRAIEAAGNDSFVQMMAVAGGLRSQMKTDRPIGSSCSLQYAAIANAMQSGFIAGPILELMQQGCRCKPCESPFRFGFRLGCGGQNSIDALLRALSDDCLPLIRFFTIVRTAQTNHAITVALVKLPNTPRPVVIFINSNRMPVLGSAHWERVNQQGGKKMYTQCSARFDWVVGIMHRLALRVEQMAKQ